jgi:hypothetical protein
MLFRHCQRLRRDVVRSKLWVVAAVAAIAAVALPATVSGAGRVHLIAELDGKNEVPDKGDPNGSGAADLTVNVNKRKVCFEIAFEGIEPPNAGHIHEGDEGVAGGVVIPLFEDSDGATELVEGCTKAKRSLLRKIKRNPGHYYVNLHNAEYPAGAIRGQLVKL